MNVLPVRQNTTPEISAGSVYDFPYPFVKELYDDGDPEGGPSLSWRPGVRFESRVIRGDGEFDEVFDAVADSIGRQVITVVSTHKPGAFPTRVFFTRKWKDPQGREFGKGKLHIKSLAAFRVLIRGWRGERFTFAKAEGGR